MWNIDATLLFKEKLGYDVLVKIQISTILSFPRKNVEVMAERRYETLTQVTSRAEILKHFLKQERP